MTESVKGYFNYVVPSRSAIDANAVNVTAIKITETVVDAGTVNLYNLVKRCGFTDWAVGVEKDLTGNPCMSSSLQPGRVLYSIATVIGDTMQLGVTDGANDGSSEALRHTKLGATTYTRQP